MDCKCKSTIYRTIEENTLEWAKFLSCFVFDKILNHSSLKVDKCDYIKVRIFCTTIIQSIKYRKNLQKGIKYFNMYI